MEFLTFVIVIVIVFVIWLVTSSLNGKLKTSANATSTNDNYPTPYELLQAAKRKRNKLNLILAGVLSVPFLYYVVDQVILTSNSNTNSSNSLYKKNDTQWYQGGTLHEANIYEWKNASESNKLATCADFVASLDSDPNLSMEVRKSKAINLRACINESTKGINNVDDDRVSEVAAICAITLGYGK